MEISADMSQHPVHTKVFVSYSHKDAEWLARLRVHLRPLERDYEIQIWDDTRIQPGSKWKGEIQKAIQSSTVAVLLVSADFLASEFIATNELPPLLKAAEENGALILPLILSPCRFSSTRTLSEFQSVNPPSKPLISMTRGEQEEILVKLSEQIEAFQSHRMRSESPEIRTANLQGHAGIQTDQPRATAVKTSSKLARYEFLHTVCEGHYSRVRKCRIRDTGETCIVKETTANRASLSALHALKDLGCRNVATPRVVWEDGGKVYEELPCVGGTRLSRAIVPGIGGLSGSVLESFHDQMMDILGKLHAAKIIHRDIHPDNIYLVTKPRGSSRSVHWVLDSWEYNTFGHGDESFFLGWVLVDCTFATLLSESSKSRCRHGSYTPEEQETGAAIPASDMYAFGATLYYAITGREIPSYEARRSDPRLLSEFPSGGHSSRDFPRHLESLLSLDPSERGLAPLRLHTDTVSPAYTGTLRLSDSLFLIADVFSSECQLLTGKQALDFFSREGEHLRKYHPEVEVDYWIERLSTTGVDH
jgi:hypothetical protein